MGNNIKYSRLRTAIPTTGPEGVHYSPPPRRITVHVIVYSILVLLNLGLAGSWYRAHRSTISAECIRPQLTYSPAKSVYSYERKRLWRDIDHNVFTGEPRPDHDAAWRHLMEPMIVHVTPEEWAQAKLSESTLTLKDGSGYVAELSVYHELHCIRRIRRHLYLDHYYPNMTADPGEYNKEKLHIDHCLEYWREAAMCRGDASLASMFWRDGLPTSRVYSEHECINWEALDVWARGRMMDIRNLEPLDQTNRFELMTTSAGKTVKVNDPTGEEIHP